MTSAKSGALIVTLTSLYHLYESIDDDEGQITAVAFSIGGNRQPRDKIHGQNSSIDKSAPVTIRGRRRACARTFDKRETLQPLT